MMGSVWHLNRTEPLSGYCFLLPSKLWTWQGNFESWVKDPLHVRPIARAIWDPHFGQPAVEAFTRGGAPGPVNIAYSDVYQWWYTIGLRTNTCLGLFKTLTRLQPVRSSQFAVFESKGSR
ncbi:hypothetical protein L1987_59470 [Smallanthus sonchifolius]|uniref:Uncharacterized protein n=1 Tax=Smallanthus sonchifolius TaxID=185202 RepID=A0ACB9D5Q4_9ASTR|nr:hypothetical protein L1987_59470 [Smallanthus sonchifolius]